MKIMIRFGIMLLCAVILMLSFYFGRISGRRFESLPSNVFNAYMHVRILWQLKEGHDEEAVRRLEMLLDEEVYMLRKLQKYASKSVNKDIENIIVQIRDYREKCDPLYGGWPMAIVPTNSPEEYQETIVLQNKRRADLNEVVRETILGTN